MNAVLRWIFFILIIRPLVLIVIGLNIRHAERLPRKGPAVVIANHNSHLDTMVLVSLLPVCLLRKIRPVAAADYFLCNPVLTWFATQIIGIIPVKRNPEAGKHPLEGAFTALEAGNILVIFPEGTRGEPETMASLKRGIAHIALKFSQVPIIPVFLYGLGKALPKGEAILVPFFCDVYVGEPMYGEEDMHAFMNKVTQQFEQLRREAEPHEWV